MLPCVCSVIDHRLRGKNKQGAHEPQGSASRMILPHFDVFCNLLLNRRTAILSLFVLYNEQERENDILALYRLTVRGFVPV